MAGGRTVRLRTTATHEGQRLDVVLGASLPEALARPVAKATVRRLIMAGAVEIAGRPLRTPGRLLRAGQAIEVRVDVSRLPLPRSEEDVAFTLTPAAILHEDDALIAVDKPAGLPTVPTADPARPSLVREVEAYLTRRAGGAVTLGVHQRLDRDTSGVVLFAKEAAANPALARAFAAHEVEKTYHALTARPSNVPDAPWRVASELGPIGKRRMGSVRQGGQRAETDLEVLEAFREALLVEARPRTGRKHQIRVHLAEARFPVLGDPLYGDRARDAPRLMLHASRLALPHPVTGGVLSIGSPWPADFQAQIEVLRRA